MKHHCVFSASSMLCEILLSLTVAALNMDVESSMLNNNNNNEKNSRCKSRCMLAKPKEMMGSKKKRELEKERSSGSADSGCFQSNGNSNSNGNSGCNSGSSDQRVQGNGPSRLSKIGRRLRDSCRQLKAKSGNTGQQSNNPDDFESQRAAHESSRTKHYVAMDFSGRVGRIVESKDVRACSSVKDGYAYFRRRISPKEAEQHLTHMQASAHVHQPWFHKNMSRDLAQRILTAHNVDGSFLVRESSVSGGFVISYSFNGRTFHAQVLPDMESRSELDACNVYYTLDEGKTRFFDLLQMVDFYQLNKASLQCKLSHMIVAKKTEDNLQGRRSHHSSGSSSSQSGMSNNRMSENGQLRPDSPMSRSESSCPASEASMESQPHEDHLNLLEGNHANNEEGNNNEFDDHTMAAYDETNNHLHSDSKRP